MSPDIDTISQVVSLLDESDDIKRVGLICSQRNLPFSTNPSRFFRAPFKVLWIIRSSPRLSNILSLVRTIREDSSIRSPIAVLIDTESLTLDEKNTIIDSEIADTYIVDTSGENRQEKLEVQLNRIFDLVTPKSRTLSSLYSADDLAYEKIEQAWRSNAKTLNLSGMGLTELPKTIDKLGELNELYLNDNELTGLPPRFSQLRNLQRLNLGYNPVHEIPEVLKECVQLQDLFLYQTKLSNVPRWINQITSLARIDISGNQIGELPDTLSGLQKLKLLILGGSYGGNPLNILPECIRQFRGLETLFAASCGLNEIPDWIEELIQLREVYFHENKITDLPISITKLIQLQQITLFANPLNPELAAAYANGLESIRTYLRAKTVVPNIINEVKINEAKLILVGEGEVGKTSLMDALLDRPWQEHDTTHGIEIQQIKVTDPETQTEITLNGWDFGGQRVYRPTHQLFFSAPAVYLVVWKPREGPQQGFVKEWIRLIKHREPDAKILVVATHGGPQQRQPDIDRQELWDLFGRETVADFFFVDSKPDAHGNRKGIDELKLAIARLAAQLPEVGRSVPKSFQDVRAALQARNVPYLPLDEVLAICRAHKMDDEIARLFITISHRLGHLTHYENDPTLRDIVILRPDWLATAISYIFDDEVTRAAHGLVRFSRLNRLWDDPTRAVNTRYPVTLHPIFLRLMERFDLSYRVADSTPRGESDPQSLIAQLVPDIRPENFATTWISSPSSGDLQQTQICRIVDDKDNSATAEGLFYQLIVRLHKYSLGRAAYADSVHWQRGLVLDDYYNGRALLEHKGNDVHITVRAPYPERFLALLTEEVKYLVESFWEGLRCDVMVPCLNPEPCIGLFEVRKLIENKKRGRPESPCPVCNEWQNIDSLLLNAPAAAQPISLDTLLKEFAQVRGHLSEVNDNTRRILSQVDKQYADLTQIFTDEAKEGPRLFSLFPLDGSKFNSKNWVRAKFRLVLWCEHSRLPLPALNGKDSKKGVYDLDLDREWFKKAAPYLKLVTSTLSLVLPVASSTLKVVDDTTFKTLEDQLSFGKDIIDAVAGEGTAINEFVGATDTTVLEYGVAIRSAGATLRELHALLKAKDPGFGGLVRVMNKRQEFLWVHERFAGEY